MKIFKVYHQELGEKGVTYYTTNEQVAHNMYNDYQWSMQTNADKIYKKFHDLFYERSYEELTEDEQLWVDCHEVCEFMNRSTENYNGGKRFVVTGMDAYDPITLTLMEVYYECIDVVEE